jgi:hypothetical protein
VNANRLKINCNSTVKRSKWNLKSIGRDPKAIEKQLQRDCKAIEKAIEKQLQRDCKAIEKEFKKRSKSDRKAIAT